MQASSLINAAPAGFISSHGVRHFLPPVPPFHLPQQPPRGSFFPGFPPRFPPPLPPVVHGAPFIPPHQFLPRGQNFPVPPQFSPDPPHWAPYPRRPPKNKHTRHHGKPQRDNFHSGSSTSSTRGQYVCSPCHKEYKSQQTYDIHLATHVKCSKCNFECSKGAMHDHELIHYLPPELTCASNEDIAKWREERKRHFPTAANMFRKKQIQEKREKQGDVANTPLYRYVSRVCGGSQEFSRERGGKRNHWVVGSNKKHYSHHVRELGSEERGRGRGKRGLGGRRGRGERKPRNENARKGVGKPDGCGLRYAPAKKPTLLEKLLAREIRVEQNTLLQCVRHIVSQKFFRPDNDKKAIEEEGGKEMEEGKKEEEEGKEMEEEEEGKKDDEGEEEGKDEEGEEFDERVSECASASNEQMTED